MLPKISIPSQNIKIDNIACFRYLDEQLLRLIDADADSREKIIHSGAAAALAAVEAEKEAEQAAKQPKEK